MGGFKNLGWAEQGLKFLKSAYASPGQPHLLIFAREDADGGERGSLYKDSGPVAPAAPRPGGGPTGI